MAKTAKCKHSLFEVSRSRSSIAFLYAALIGAWYRYTIQMVPGYFLGGYFKVTPEALKYPRISFDT